MSERIELVTNVWVDADLDVDQDGKVNLVVLLDTDEDRALEEVPLSFEKIIEDAIDMASVDLSHETIRYLYTLAHEMTKASERLGDAASEFEYTLAEWG